MKRLAELLFIHGSDLLKGDLHQLDVIRGMERELASRLAFETSTKQKEKPSRRGSWL
jgi:hypothetical protein